MQNNDQWAEELLLIRTVLDKTGLEVAVKWGADVYTYNGKNIVSYGGFQHYCAIWFYNGVFLKDKDKVLVNAQEGKTKSLRQWRITSKEEIDEEKILQYVKEAVEVEKKGLKIAPAKFEPLDTPPLLLQAFEADELLKSTFSALTPGKQKEYILYLNEAKQEGTRINRLEKIKPMIRQGQGLNDKYK